MKAIHAWTDLGYGDFELCYWRDKEKREVDFVITESRKPVAFFETKLSETVLSPSLSYLAKQFGSIPQIQLVEKAGVDFMKGNLRIVSADAYLANLP